MSHLCQRGRVEDEQLPRATQSLEKKKSLNSIQVQTDNVLTQAVNHLACVGIEITDLQHGQSCFNRQLH